jgi:hypothetical protein
MRQAKTPYRRVLASPEVLEERKEQLRKEYQELNPVVLQRRIEGNLEELWRLHG